MDQMRLGGAGGPSDVTLDPNALLIAVSTSVAGLAFAGASYVEPLFRPDGRVWLTLLGVGLLGFGLVTWWQAGQSPLLRLSQSVYMMVMSCLAGVFSADERLLVGMAAGMGMATISVAIHEPPAVVRTISGLALATAVVMIASSGPGLAVLVALFVMMAAQCLLPASTVLAFRERLEAAIDTMQHLATTDTLTGLANRRGLLERASILFAEAHRSGRSVAVLMADIDHFKHFNDTHGHLRGDEVLCSVARAVRASFRASDVAARFGGEELCVVAAIEHPDDLAVLAERLCTRVEQDPAGVTISIGAVSRQVDRQALVEDELWAMIDEADVLLYAAKDAGRNAARVFSAA